MRPNGAVSVSPWMTSTCNSRATSLMRRKFRYEKSDRASGAAMKRITLENIRDCLVNMQFEVTVPEDMAERARLAVQRMIDLPPPVTPARYDLVKARHHVAVELI